MTNKLLQATRRAVSFHWFHSSGPSEEIVRFSRAVNDHIVALKDKGYFCLFALKGRDAENMSPVELVRLVADVQSAFDTLPEEITRYEYVRKIGGRPIQRKSEYPTPEADEYTQHRTDFLNRNGGFSSTELFWGLSVEPDESIKLTGWDSERGKNSFLEMLEKAVSVLAEQFSEELGLRLLNKNEVFSFFAYLASLEPYSVEREPEADYAWDRQLGTFGLDWNKDHVVLNNRYAKCFSALRKPKVIRPNLFEDVLHCKADVLLCSIWSGRSDRHVENEVTAHEDYVNMFRESLAAFAFTGGDDTVPVKTARSKAADQGVDELAAVLNSLRRHSYGRYSFYCMVHGRDLQGVREAAISANKGLIRAKLPYIEERQGCLSAYYSLWPGNAKFRKPRRWWLRNDYAAQMCHMFAPNTGNMACEDLDDEYLAAFETRTGSEYYLSPYYNGVRTELVLGDTGEGKSVFGNQILASNQKYGGWTFVFDFGHSYESTINYFGGEVISVGEDGPRVALFQKEPIERNLQFLFQFVRMLLRKGGAILGPEDEDAITSSVSEIYRLAPGLRRLGNILLPPHLMRYLSKWIGKGIYAKYFDNVEDSIHIAQIGKRPIGFDFSRLVKDMGDLVEPILTWQLREITEIIQDEANLGFPKHIIADEIWKQVEDPQLLGMVLNEVKTSRKNLGGITLLTHDPADLGANAYLITKTCATVYFLRNPGFDRKRYAELFELNRRELYNLSKLRKYEILMKRNGESKIFKHTVNPQALRLFTTKPKERLQRAEAVKEHGIRGAYEREEAVNA